MGKGLLLIGYEQKIGYQKRNQLMREMTELNYNTGYCTNII